VIRVVAVLLLALAATPIRAAEIKIDTSTSPALITIEGTINDGDDDLFRTRIGTIPQAVVGLDSPGGNLHAGIEIGTTIRMRGYATTVPMGSKCASACGLIWLGGSPRTILYDAQGNTGLVGFHAAINTQTGAMSVGNAWAGSYFGKLGLSDEAIAYLTEASPDSIQWLTSADAERLGIRVSYVKVDPTAPAQPPAKTIAGEPASDQSGAVASDEAVNLWLDRYFTAGNAPNNTQTRENVLAWYYPWRHVTDAAISYYKRSVTLDELVADKFKFMNRWPNRRYRLHPGSVSINWQGKVVNLVTVNGVVDWTCSSPERRESSAGSAQFTFVLWIENGGGFSIVSEDGRVITRKVSAETYVGQRR
jgi:hypothetical protein